MRAPLTLLGRAIRTRRIALDRSSRVRHRDLQDELEEARRAQRTAFDRLARSAAARFETIRSLDDPQATSPMWQAYAGSLERDLLPVPRFDFLRNPVLMETMLVRGARLLRRQLTWLETRFDEASLRRILEEDLVGSPAIASARYRCSHLLVHHLYSLERFRAATGADWRRQGTIVELGGGFGGLARLIRRAAESPPTHLIVDLPISSLLQWLFLATVFGERRVRLITSPSEELVPGTISVAPLAIAEALPLEPDLFISTWSLDETPARNQERIAARWFGAGHLLLAYCERGRSRAGARVTTRLAEEAGASLEEVGALASGYAFR